MSCGEVEGGSFTAAAGGASERSVPQDLWRPSVRRASCPSVVCREGCVHEAEPACMIRRPRRSVNCLLERDFPHPPASQSFGTLLEQPTAQVAPGTTYHVVTLITADNMCVRTWRFPVLWRDDAPHPPGRALDHKRQQLCRRRAAPRPMLRRHRRRQAGLRDLATMSQSVARQRPPVWADSDTTIDYESWWWWSSQPGPAWRTAPRSALLLCQKTLPAPTSLPMSTPARCEARPTRPRQQQAPWAPASPAACHSTATPGKTPDSRPLDHRMTPASSPCPPATQRTLTPSIPLSPAATAPQSTPSLPSAAGTAFA